MNGREFGALQKLSDAELEASLSGLLSTGARIEARIVAQVHHRQPWARGGPDSFDNLALLCHAHNRLLAERDFGHAHLDKVVAHRTKSRPKCP